MIFLKSKSVKKQISVVLLFPGIILLYVLTGCPFRFLTGISCPGCGMTRAFCSVLKGDFPLAAYYNKFIFVLPFPLLAFFLRKQIGIKAFYLIALIFIIGFIFYYIRRMAEPNDIVYIRPTQGAIYKIMEFLKEAYNYVKNSNLSA